MQREKDAVEEWLTKTNYSVHLMRDNPSHTFAIMGGMWGVRQDEHNRRKFLKFRVKLFQSAYLSLKERDLDQPLLEVFAVAGTLVI